MRPCNVFRSSADDVHRELSVLATKWANKKLPGRFEHFVDKGQVGDGAHAFAKGIKRALDGFHVHMELNL